MATGPHRQQPGQGDGALLDPRGGAEGRRGGRRRHGANDEGGEQGNEDEDSWTTHGDQLPPDGSRFPATGNPDERMCSPCHRPASAPHPSDRRTMSFPLRGRLIPPPLVAGTRANRLPPESANSDHQPNGCWTGGWGNWTPRAVNSW